MIKTGLLSELEIEYFLQLPEVIQSKQQIDSQSTGSIYFNVSIDDSIKEKIAKQLGMELNGIDKIPMRWIKGDTRPHIDTSVRLFDETYLAYLTDNPGKLVIDNTPYPITKGTAYIFPEGLSHETIDTGNEPRLLFGPMNEYGISVGGPQIYYPGGTTVYVRKISSDIEYSIDQTNWITAYFQLYIANSDTSLGLLKIEFITDITLDQQYQCIVCYSTHIQIGSTSLNVDGTRPKIIIDGVADYPGLIQNGYDFSDGYDNIFVYNIEVTTINGTTLAEYGGWIGQHYFGKNTVNNVIINCSSDSSITTNSGGIVGARAGPIKVIGCSSSGTINENAGGIIGINSPSSGIITCESCWSTGASYTDAGGIFGKSAATSGEAIANKCYSTGLIQPSGGGIFGSFAGDGGEATAQNCYSLGNISATAGGIFGEFAASDGGITTAINCYSTGTTDITTPNNGIYGDNKQSGASEANCYQAKGNWQTTTANTYLTGTPAPYVGTVWIFTGVNQPYELKNMGYTPYDITNIDTTTTPTLKQIYNETIYPGESSESAIITGKSYTILDKSGGDSSSYVTIDIDSNTGVISTTANTNVGVYTLYIRNNGSYNITILNLIVQSSVIPNAPICFPAGTLVLTDQGEIQIDKIDISIHTIHGKNIAAITESIPLDNYLICIPKHSLGDNVPNRNTILSRHHKVVYNKKLIEAEDIIQYVPNVYKIPYDKRKLYNVLMDEYSSMSINNLLVETLHPNNLLAKIYTGKYTVAERNLQIKTMNAFIKKQKENKKKQLKYFA
jgi:hypothetical protein